MNIRTARFASLAGSSLLALTLSLGGQFFGVGSAAAASSDDAARIPRVSVARPQIEITGIVSAIGAGTVTVAGRTVTITGAELSGVLAVGAQIKLHASIAADGSLRARELRVLARPAASAAPAAPAAPATDDHGVDGATHDANDDHGVDGAAHDASDDNGVDGATHDAGDDHGTDGGHGGHGGNDDGGKHK